MGLVRLNRNVASSQLQRSPVRTNTDRLKRSDGR